MLYDYFNTAFHFKIGDVLDLKQELSDAIAQIEYFLRACGDIRKMEVENRISFRNRSWERLSIISSVVFSSFLLFSTFPRLPTCAPLQMEFATRGTGFPLHSSAYWSVPVTFRDACPSSECCYHLRDGFCKMDFMSEAEGKWQT